ncbi:hypothetical protein YC2023_015091 [Brassica napus]
MKKRKTYHKNGDRTGSNITPETIKDKKTISNAIQFCSNSFTNRDIPLRSVYYRLFEGIENRIVPCNTNSLYQQISMLSPQTPRNIRRLQLGIDTPTYQISVTPKQSSCLTSLKCKLTLLVHTAQWGRHRLITLTRKVLDAAFKNPHFTTGINCMNISQVSTWDYKISKKESIQNLNPGGLGKLLIHNNGKITITRKRKDGFLFSKPPFSLSLSLSLNRGRLSLGGWAGYGHPLIDL